MDDVGSLELALDSAVALFAYLAVLTYEPRIKRWKLMRNIDTIRVDLERDFKKLRTTEKQSPDLMELFK